VRLKYQVMTNMESREQSLLARWMLNYGEDLQTSRRNGLRMLEVGSGTHPQTAWLPELEVLAVDISLPLLELGSLYFGSRFAERLGFVCADASNLPLKSAQFDAIALFSALHHFPEPDSLLHAPGRLLRPNGVIFVMCEPVGKSLDDAAAVRDLAKGINEQISTLDEYRLFFARASLKPRFLRVDGGSLKAVLLPVRLGMK
jgi:ubiquinone/menaquinone biosynthesis C-methylase UbiE